MGQGQSGEESSVIGQDEFRRWTLNDVKVSVMHSRVFLSRGNAFSSRFVPAFSAP